MSFTVSLRAELKGASQRALSGVQAALAAPAGEVQVRAGDDSLVVAVPLVEGKRIEAGRRETFRVAMPALPPGKYTIYAVVDFGGETLTAAQAELEIRP